MMTNTPLMHGIDPAVVGTWCRTIASQPRQNLNQVGTKVVCTLGPATSDVESIRGLIQAGASVFRLNFSHGTHQQHDELLEKIRTAARQLDRSVGILQDLGGPKIRLTRLPDDSDVGLAIGQRVCLTTEQHFDSALADAFEGKPTGWAKPKFDMATNYQAILSDLRPGEPILINDGRVRLKVVACHSDHLECEVLHGGLVSRGKGINLPQAHLSTPSVTDKDWADLAWGVKHDVDFIALSFVRDAQDLIAVRDHLERVGSAAQLIAKIERPEALSNIEGILQWSDGIMVARGDLAIETDCAQVPLVQKHLIQRCRELNKPVITATQLLDSMVDSPMPSRAEISDIANAVLDGTDALMLSNETAVGKYPRLAVETVIKVCQATQGLATRRFAAAELPTETRIGSIVQSAAAVAARCQAVAMAVYTQSGFAARHFASLRLDCPVIACTNLEVTRRQMELSYGINPWLLDDFMDRNHLIPHLTQVGLSNQWWGYGDTIVVVASHDGCGGDLNMIQIVTIAPNF